MAATPDDTSSLSATYTIDLTEIHEQSDLQIEHQSRHSYTGFLIDGKALSALCTYSSFEGSTHELDMGSRGGYYSQRDLRAVLDVS